MRWAGSNMKLQKIHSEAMKIDLWDALIKKVKQEQGIYEAWLKTLNSDKILDYAQEYSVREEIVNLIETTLYSIDEMKAMLKSPNLLDDIYNEYKHFGIPYISMLNHFIEVIAYRIMNSEGNSAAKNGVNHQ